MSLNLKRADPPVAKGIHNPSRVEYRPRHPPHTAREASNPPPAAEKDGFDASQAKDLNVLFQWNGHTWDAFEVLGIPAGSSVSAARSAHDRLMAKVDPESRPFIAAALAAVSRRTGT